MSDDLRDKLVEKMRKRIRPRMIIPTDADVRIAAGAMTVGQDPDEMATAIVDILLPTIEQHDAENHGPPEGWTERVEHEYPRATTSALVTGRKPSRTRRVWLGPQEEER